MADTLRQRLRRRLSRFARPRQSEPLPARLDRRRVYVLPTRFGLFYAVLVTAMLVGALNYNNNPALLLALLLASAGLASLIAAHLQLSGLQLDAVSAEPVPAGQPLRVQVALSTRDQRERRGLRLSCLEIAGGVPVITGDAVVAELILPTTRRGWLDPERLEIWTTQPLGLARAWAWFWPRQWLLVYPSPEPNGPPLPDSEGGGSRARRQASGDDVHHLRAYRAGDPLRAIAWKPSARREHLLVREFEQPVGLEVDLAWSALAALPGEQRIRRLAHWVDLAEREGRRYRLRLPGDVALGPSRGPAHRHACLRALALLPHG
ncbi:MULTISPECIES: DUF58 domain-containing protein [Pseudoxanthomonas]|uniref:DUF58 domain-containing protein n=1 Tax=unclassified Pseudoxanthomonas TaxID=2645906 RepID=UPI0016084592|nr:MULTISPECIES: DUF58 domain-containing protein [Pseudoxanthomonas]MBB3274862.1 uncharacterized protein (DUF58 family) [Pseudoxanthomonas sp. OG2]MBV7475246.1 DUF58 domain-containing protein [Pseudoxanthomonas sp. PXM05]MCL6711514.1 DUF58 domain-containing protein [Pseudomonas sp. R2.Fl]UBB23789.1 DUF58 domain-containing protein [Pseudoxanthomonas japonensis]